MKKLASFILALVLSNGAFAVDKIVLDIQELCLMAKDGKYSQTQGKAQLQADGSVKLISGGGKAEISFTKGEWDGVQQVLKEHQAGDNKDYRACVANALPYFKGKVRTVASKSTKNPTAKPVAATQKPVATAKPAPVSESDGDTNTQNIGSQSAEKIINATEINGNIDMGK